MGSNSIACGNNADVPFSTADNTWYRAFQLSDYGITTAFHVTRVHFAIQESLGSPQVQIRIGSYTGTVGATTIDPAVITPLNTAQATIPPTSTGETVNTPIIADIAAGGKFVVQVAAPDLLGTGSYVYIGATTATESQPGYISSNSCGINPPKRPIDVDMTTFPNVHIIMTVTGTHF